MKIAIFSDCFLPMINGVVTSVVILSKEMAKRGHKVYIIAPKIRNNFDDSEQFHPNITVKRIPSCPTFIYKDFRFTSPFSFYIFKYLKKIKVDLIHFHTPVGLGAQAIILSRLFRVPLVGTFHTFFPKSEYLKHARLNNRFFQKIAWFYSKMFYNQCRLMTCPSQGARNDLIRHHFKPRIVCISNGVEMPADDQAGDKDSCQKDDTDKNLVLYVGRIAYEKNIVFLIDSFSKVVKKSPQIKLYIVGDGPQVKELKERIQRHSLEKNVIRAGEMEHSALMNSALYRKCRLFITASRTETQGIALLEAQARNLVCIGINATGTNELIKDGFNGYTVQHNDEDDFARKILRLLSDDALYNEMKKNTAIMIKKHDMKKIGTIWEKEYQRLIASTFQGST